MAKSRHGSQLRAEGAHLLGHVGRLGLARARRCSGPSRDRPPGAIGAAQAGDEGPVARRPRHREVRVVMVARVRPGWGCGQELMFAASLQLLDHGAVAHNVGGHLPAQGQGVAPRSHEDRPSAAGGLAVRPLAEIAALALGEEALGRVGHPPGLAVAEDLDQIPGVTDGQDVAELEALLARSALDCQQRPPASAITAWRSEAAMSGRGAALRRLSAQGRRRQLRQRLIATAIRGRPGLALERLVQVEAGDGQPLDADQPEGVVDVLAQPGGVRVPSTRPPHRRRRREGAARQTTAADPRSCRPGGATRARCPLHRHGIGERPSTALALLGGEQGGLDGLGNLGFAHEPPMAGPAASWRMSSFMVWTPRQMMVRARAEVEVGRAPAGLLVTRRR